MITGVRGTARLRVGRTARAAGTLVATFLGTVALLATPLAAQAASPTVTFADPELRRCVAATLGQPSNRPVTADRARSVTVLDCEDQVVAGLAGIEALTNLRVLELPLGNEITDLRPLAGLTGLRELVAFHGTIRDLTPLRRLTGLQRLDIASNPVVSLAPLASLTGLRDLSVGGDEGGSWRSLEPLRHLPLTGLSLGSGAWTTIEPLRGKTSLRVLELGQDARPVAVSALGTLSGLRDLRLGLPKGTVLAPLARLTGLTHLALGPDAGDLSALRPLRRLQVLTAVLPDDDGSVLAGKPDLRELTLTAPRLHDLGALRTSPRLTRLVVVGGRLADVSGLRDARDLQEVLLSGVARADLAPLSRLPALDYLSVTDSRLDPLRGFGSGFPALTTLELTGDRINSLTGFRVPPLLSSVDLSSNALGDIGALSCGLLVNAPDQRVTASRARPGQPYDLRLRSVASQRVRLSSGGSRWSSTGTTITYASAGTYRVRFTAEDRPDTTCDPGVTFDGTVTQQVVDAHPVRPPHDR